MRPRRNQWSREINDTPIKRGDVKKGGFVAAVSGKRRGKGSSREQSPYAERSAGIQLVIAENIERIYKQNCQNLGVLTSTDFSLIDCIRRGEEIPLSVFTQGEDEITRQVIEYGGLFPFNVARMQGKVSVPPITTGAASDDGGGEDFRAAHGQRSTSTVSQSTGRRSTAVEPIDRDRQPSSPAIPVSPAWTCASRTSTSRRWRRSSTSTSSARACR